MSTTSNRRKPAATATAVRRVALPAKWFSLLNSAHAAASAVNLRTRTEGAEQPRCLAGWAIASYAYPAPWRLCYRVLRLLSSQDCRMAPDSRLCACGSGLRGVRCCQLDLAILPPTGAERPLAPVIERAVELHRGNNDAEAEKLCLDVLELAPGQPDALSRRRRRLCPNLARVDMRRYPPLPSPWSSG